MRYEPFRSWVAGCSTHRTYAPSEVFTSFRRRRIATTRAGRHLSHWSGDPSPDASLPGIEKSSANPAYAIWHTDLCRWKSAEHIEQSTCALLHVLVLQRTASRTRANTPDTLSRLAAPTHSQHRQPWPYRASTGRLDLQEVQLSELEAQESLPDVLSLYGSISPYAHPVTIDLRDLLHLFSIYFRR